MTLFSSILLIISNAVTFRRDKSIFYNRFIIIAIPYCISIIIELIVLTFMITSLGLYGGLIHLTTTNQTFNVLIYITTLVIAQLTAFYPRKMWSLFFDNPITRLVRGCVNSYSTFLNKMGEQYKIIEYPLMLLFIILGGLFLMSCCDIVSIFLAIELQSFGLYLLAAMYKNSELSVSAALVYFLLGGLSSCFILLGTSLLYANSGSTILDGHYIITGISNVTDFFGIKISDLYDFSYLNVSFLIMSVGLLFKISAAPFHYWSPDVYDGVPTIVTTFISIIAKISILILLLELIVFTSNLLLNEGFNWSYSLLISCSLSFLIGTVLGLSQLRIKRLLAYSTVSHIGFILLALAINTMESLEAFIFYILQYTLSNLNAFFIIISIGFSLFSLKYTDNKLFEQDSGDLPDKNNSPVQLTTEMKGYYLNNPILSLSMAITLFSFIGLPPLMGFFAKQMVLSSAIASGYLFIAILAIITSVISASYYLNVIKEIFFKQSNLSVKQEYIDAVYKYTVVFFNNKFASYNYRIYNICLSSFLTFNISTLTLSMLLFMFASQEWLSTTRLLSLNLIKT